MHHGLPAYVHDAQVQYSSNGSYALEGSMPVQFDEESLKQLKAYGAPVTFTISVPENSMNASSGGPIPISQDEVRKAIQNHQQSMPEPSGARAS
jgi:cysteine synthase